MSVLVFSINHYKSCQNISNSTGVTIPYTNNQMESCCAEYVIGKNYQKKSQGFQGQLLLEILPFKRKVCKSNPSIELSELYESFFTSQVNHHNLQRRISCRSTKYLAQQS